MLSQKCVKVPVLAPQEECQSMPTQRCQAVPQKQCQSPPGEVCLGVPTPVPHSAQLTVLQAQCLTVPSLQCYREPDCKCFPVTIPSCYSMPGQQCSQAVPPCSPEGWPGPQQPESQGGWALHLPSLSVLLHEEGTLYPPPSICPHPDLGPGGRVKSSVSLHRSAAGARHPAAFSSPKAFTTALWFWRYK